MTARKAPLPETDEQLDAELRDLERDLRKHVSDLCACVIAADALAAWVADGCDEVAITLADAYAAARAKVAT